MGPKKYGPQNIVGQEQLYKKWWILDLLGSTIFFSEKKKPVCSNYLTPRRIWSSLGHVPNSVYASQVLQDFLFKG